MTFRICCGCSTVYRVGVVHNIYGLLPTIYNMLSTAYNECAVGNGIFCPIYVVDTIVYVVQVSILCMVLWTTFLYCGYMLWMYVLRVHIHCGRRLYVVDICCGQHLLVLYVVDDYMLWMTCTHNIYVCRPQHILVLYMLWVYVVDCFDFYRCLTSAPHDV